MLPYARNSCTAGYILVKYFFFSDMRTFSLIVIYELFGHTYFLSLQQTLIILIYISL
jgi:hypothetical protein